MFRVCVAGALACSMTVMLTGCGGSACENKVHQIENEETVLCPDFCSACHKDDCNALTQGSTDRGICVGNFNTICFCQNLEVAGSHKSAMGNFTSSSIFQAARSYLDGITFDGITV